VLVLEERKRVLVLVMSDVVGVAGQQLKSDTKRHVCLSVLCGEWRGDYDDRQMAIPGWMKIQVMVAL
jgi:hypothetical protein